MFLNLNCDAVGSFFVLLLECIDALLSLKIVSIYLTKCRYISALDYTILMLTYHFIASVYASATRWTVKKK